MTAKIRLGWDFATRNYLEVATRLEAAGIQGLAVHGRTRSQRYDPSADWMAIAEVKSAVTGAGGFLDEVWQPMAQRINLDCELDPKLSGLAKVDEAIRIRNDERGDHAL
mgnify:CR=1 FL=1